VVLVVRAERQDEIAHALRARWGARVPFDCAVQSLDTPLAAAPYARDRMKPWGTAHAVLAARRALDGPFAVVNADDFYGRAPYDSLASFLRAAPAPGAPAYAIAGYPLTETLSDAGPVNRAVCRTDAEGWLVSIEERRGLTATSVGTDNLAGALVSMNCWAFTPAIFPQLDAGFSEFLAAHGAEADAEYTLPTVVGALVRERRARVRVLRTTGRWCGVTYAADAPRVAAFLEAATARGEYPRDLWA